MGRRAQICHDVVYLSVFVSYKFLCFVVFCYNLTIVLTENRIKATVPIYSTLLLVFQPCPAGPGEDFCMWIAVNSPFRCVFCFVVRFLFLVVLGAVLVVLVAAFFLIVSVVDLPLLVLLPRKPQQKVQRKTMFRSAPDIENKNKK